MAVLFDHLEIYKDNCFSFFFLHVGRYSDEQNVKEMWNFGTSWNWCKVKNYWCFPLLLKLRIWKYSSFQEIWEKQTKAIWKSSLFWIWDNLHHLGKHVSFSEVADYPAVFAKINVPPQVLLCFIIKKIGADSKTHRICVFLHFQETLLLDFL